MQSHKSAFLSKQRKVNEKGTNYKYEKSVPCFSLPRKFSYYQI